MNPTYILACTALFLTIYQSWIQRRHNRLSVRPHLDWNGFSNAEAHGLSIKMQLENNGLGPARIIERRYLLDGRALDCGDNDPVPIIVEQCFKDYPGYILRSHANLSVGAVLKPGDIMPILEIFFPGKKLSDSVSIRSTMTRANLEVDYESFYKEKFCFSTRVGRKT